MVVYACTHIVAYMYTWQIWLPCSCYIPDIQDITCITSHRIASRRVASRRVASHHITSHHITSYHIHRLAVALDDGALPDASAAQGQGLDPAPASRMHMPQRRSFHAAQRLPTATLIGLSRFILNGLEGRQLSQSVGCYPALHKRSPLHHPRGPSGPRPQRPRAGHRGPRGSGSRACCSAANRVGLR